MIGDQKWNAEPQCELGDFCYRVAKMPTLIERRQTEPSMCRRGSIEHEIDDRNSPPPDVVREPRFHSGVRDVAERVIEEMREDVGEHDKAACEAYLPHADAAQPICNSDRRLHAGRAHVN